jgi:hypothetical protein
MKRTLATLFAGILCVGQASTQTATKFIDVNNIKTKVTNTGSMFFDGSSSVFFVPKSGAKGTIFTAAPWIGGMHNGQLHMMAETYRQNGRDLQQGPVQATYGANQLAYWDRIWSVSRSELTAFAAALQQGQTPSTTTFRDIYEWPTRGNIIGGDTTREYAPFVDVNNNRIYEPLLGDYPAIKGDQMLYAVMNDDIATHTESNGQPFKMEIHRLVYAYNLPGTLGNTLFVDYKVINKSANTYDSLLFSSFVDFDLGQYDDDYVGTDTSRNMIYAFNGDTFDNVPMGYGLTPPAEACVMLNHKLVSSMYYNNNFAPVTGNPSASMDYYNYMQGKWKTGVDKHAGDSGFALGAPVTPFSFGGDPCANNGWWEGAAGISPGDRRILGTIAPRSLAPQQSFDVTLAFVYARAQSGDHIASVCALKSAVDSVTAWYKKGGTTGIMETKQQPLSFSMYPNPANHSVTIEGIDLKNATVVFYDITGKQLKSLLLTQTENISVGDLSAGIYFVQVSSDEGTATKRLIVE